MTLLFVMLVCIVAITIIFSYNRFFREPILIDLPYSTDARELLTNITSNALKLITYVKERYPNDEGIQALVDRYKPDEMYEGRPGDLNNTYTENKGERMVICLRDTTNKLHEENLVMFPLIHELAHLADIDYDPSHGENFKKYFRILLEDAQRIGIYKHIDFPNNPKEFCGMNIKTLP